MKNKYTKLFYRAVARIRAIGANPGIVTTDRIKTVFHIGWERASKLRDELTIAGVLRKWEDADLKGTQKKSRKGNIVWKNLSKFRVPRVVSLKEKQIIES